MHGQFIASVIIALITSSFVLLNYYANRKCLKLDRILWVGINILSFTMNLDSLNVIDSVVYSVVYEIPLLLTKLSIVLPYQIILTLYFYLLIDNKINNADDDDNVDKNLQVTTLYFLFSNMVGNF